MSAKQVRRDVRRSFQPNGVGLQAWLDATTSLCEVGGFLAQTDAYRFQLRKSWVTVIEPFADQQWYGWVPGKLCCRFVPECAKGLFANDLARWRAYQHSKDVCLPSGDTPVKTLFEPRGRITCPESLALAVGLKGRQLILVHPRRGFLELWGPDSFTAYCARIANHPFLGDRASARLLPKESSSSPSRALLGTIHG